MLLIKTKNRFLNLLVILIFGTIIFLLGLGSTGLVDETPPLFAAAGKAMSESGDWLTPKVNGIFRFDKPPLIYWLMGLFYSLPKNEVWDSFGTISARLPSALASLFLMIRRPPRSTPLYSSAASDVYKRQIYERWFIKSENSIYFWG